MNNKVGSIILAVVCFFIGAVLLSEYPILGALIVFFAEATGYFFGWLSNKDKARLADDLEDANEELVEEIEKTSKEIEDLKKTLKELKEGKEAVVVSKSAKKKVSK